MWPTDGASWTVWAGSWYTATTEEVTGIGSFAPPTVAPSEYVLPGECLGTTPEVIYLGGNTTLTTNTKGFFTYGGLDSNNNPYFSKEASSFTYYMFYYPAYGRW